MNLTPQEAALAWASGKKLEAKRQDVADRWESIIQVGGVSGFWSAAIFGPDVHLFAFRIAPGETMETKSADDGGPAFPCGPGGESTYHEDGRVSHQWPAMPGMSLLDWFAGQETLAEFDHPDASYGDKLAISFAGPKPPGGWAEDPRAMFEWEAKVRAGMKYSRAAAMIEESKRRRVKP